MESIGLNHANWGVKFTVGGDDGLELIRAAGLGLLDDPSLSDEEILQVKLAIKSGLLPSKYNQFYYYRHSTFARAVAAEKVRAEVILDDLPGIFEHLHQQAATDKPRVTRHRGSEGFGDFSVNILAALAGAGKVTEPLNVKNDGYIDDLPSGMVVEVPCEIDADGVKPKEMGRLPERFAGLLYHLGAYQQQAADAAWQGNAEDAVFALAANPLVGDLDLAEKLYSEMAAACADFLPQRLRCQA